MKRLFAQRSAAARGLHLRAEAATRPPMTRSTIPGALAAALVPALTFSLSACQSAPAEIEIADPTESHGDAAISGCVPSEVRGPVSPSCGVFVSPQGFDHNAGTQVSPVATLARAIDLAAAGVKRVYACTGQFDEVVTVPAGIVVYGALDCEHGWEYLGGLSKTTIVGPEDQVALMLDGGEGVTRLEDVRVVARGGASPGSSSIAVVANEVEAELVRCTLEAGNAASGTDGEVFTHSATTGADGYPGGDACSAKAVVQGAPVENNCGEATSISGSGGISFAVSAGNGDAGWPGTTMNGGSGEKNGIPCTPGLHGDPGASGTPGAAGAGLGRIHLMGYTGVPGTSGTAGTPGQGGGGGGGSKGGFGPDKCLDESTSGGASGGSGASGGCGGAPGDPGGAGGSSIALISLNAKLTLRGVKLIARNGGDGGFGTPGQKGGLGGSKGGLGGGVPEGATALFPGCAGGPGGAGGDGGSSGGGSGGHSLSIAFTGAPPSTTDAILLFGKAGRGGAALDPTGAAASSGIAAELQEFPSTPE